MNDKCYKIAVVGATGLVGREIINILEERLFPIQSIKLFASERSAGESISIGGNIIVVQQLNRHLFKDLEIVFFSSGRGVSKEYCPLAVNQGAVVIDNSSEFRMDKSVALIVPEVNSQAIPQGPALIANPNCSTIQMAVALKPLHDVIPIKRIVVSTYQSVSGVGKDATEELLEQVRAILNCQTFVNEVFSQQIAFNIIPHIEDFHKNNYTNEEIKMEHETKKIFDDPSIMVSATCVRVPTFVGHGESINVEFHEPFSAERAKAILKNAPGVELFDNPQENDYPTPVQSAGSDVVYIGRIRQDLSLPTALNMWVVADNIRKGAALNAVQIAEEWIKNDMANH